MLRNMREKHRFSIRNQNTDHEVWYMYISPGNIIAGLIAFVIITFIIVALAVAYTPILDLIPGYPGNKSRELLITNIARLDSLNREMENLRNYSDNIVLIMSGKNPVTPSDVNGMDSASMTQMRNLIGRLLEDSVLRNQMETPGGRYSLSDPENARRALRSELDLISPVKGVVARGFSPAEGKFGVAVGTAINEQVMAVLDGTVISSSLIPSQGYVIYIQHADNMVSVYRNNVSVLKRPGERVRIGEVIAYTGSPGPQTGEGNFEFELWHNGAPVDPQNYIVF